VAGSDLDVCEVNARVERRRDKRDEACTGCALVRTPAVSARHRRRREGPRSDEAMRPGFLALLAAEADVHLEGAALHKHSGQADALAMTRAASGTELAG